MELELFFEEYLKKTPDAVLEDDFEIGYILNGCNQLFESTGKNIYKDFILNFFESKCAKAESGFAADSKNGEFDKINSGKSLFLSYEETEEEKYKTAIEDLMTLLRECPRTKDKMFCQQNSAEQNVMTCNEMYEVLPFYMEYETKYHNKAEYNDIVKQFLDRKSFVDAKDTGWYLMAVIDTIDKMSIEIFEHYKSLVGVFKKTIKNELEKELYYLLESSTMELNEKIAPDVRMMIGYAVLKACNMEVLNPEKYVDFGLKLIDGVIDDLFIEDNNVTVGITMMAYAQSLLFRNN